MTALGVGFSITPRKPPRFPLRHSRSLKWSSPRASAPAPGLAPPPPGRVGMHSLRTQCGPELQKVLAAKQKETRCQPGLAFPLTPL